MADDLASIPIRSFVFTAFMSNAREYHYIAYIDEAGDDGLATVRPIDDNGSSEWLVVSAVVIKASRENEIVEWTDKLIGSIKGYQGKGLHFRKLHKNKKLDICENISNLNARYFVVCFNKKNMRGYKNPLADNIPSQCWFYCWMTRLLLERVTNFVKWKSMEEYGEPKKVKVEFSNRGGLSYSQMNAYFRWINYQGGNTFLRFGNVHWETIDFDLLKVYPYYERSGLQLADVVASAFYKAVDKYHTGACDPSFAKALLPRMAKYHDCPSENAAGYGVKLMPSMARAQLLPEQEEIFRYYGYPQQWWAPDPSNPRAYRLGISSRQPSRGRPRIISRQPEQPGDPPSEDYS